MSELRINKRRKSEHELSHSWLNVQVRNRTKQIGNKLKFVCLLVGLFVFVGIKTDFMFFLAICLAIARLSESFNSRTVPLV